MVGGGSGSIVAVVVVVVVVFDAAVGSCDASGFMTTEFVEGVRWMVGGGVAVAVVVVVAAAAVVVVVVTKKVSLSQIIVPYLVRRLLYMVTGINLFTLTQS